MGYFVLAILFAAITAMVSTSRGNSGTAGFFLGLLLGPFGLLIAIFSRKNIGAIEREEISTGQMRKCPHCAELVKSEAVICRYCRSELDPMPKTSP